MCVQRGIEYFSMVISFLRLLSLSLEDHWVIHCPVGTLIIQFGNTRLPSMQARTTYVTDQRIVFFIAAPLRGGGEGV